MRGYSNKDHCAGTFDMQDKSIKTAVGMSIYM